MEKKLGSTMTVPSMFKGFEDLLDILNLDTKTNWYPVADVEEDDKTYVIKIDAPELNKNELDVSVKDGILTVKGNRTIEKKENGNYQRRSGEFVRSWEIDGLVNEEEIVCSYENGVVTLLLPKKEELIKKETIRKIEVK